VWAAYEARRRSQNKAHAYSLKLSENKQN